MSLVADYGSDSDTETNVVEPQNSAKPQVPKVAAAKITTTPAIPAKKVVKIVVDVDNTRDDDDAEQSSRKKLRLSASLPQPQPQPQPAPQHRPGGLNSMLPPPKVASGILPKKDSANGSSSSEPMSVISMVPYTLRNKPAKPAMPVAATLATASATTGDVTSTVDKAVATAESDEDDDGEENPAPFGLGSTSTWTSTSSDVYNQSAMGSYYQNPQDTFTQETFALSQNISESEDPSSPATATDESEKQTSTAVASNAPSGDDIFIKEIIKDKRFRDLPIQFQDIRQEEQIDINRIPVPEIPQESMFKPSASVRAYKATGHQKAKHQITWLAQHAIASERDNAERYARGMKSKRETQAKYGF